MTQTDSATTMPLDVRDPWGDEALRREMHRLELKADLIAKQRYELLEALEVLLAEYLYVTESDEDAPWLIEMRKLIDKAKEEK